MMPAGGWRVSLPPGQMGMEKNESIFKLLLVAFAFLRLENIWRGRFLKTIGWVLVIFLHPAPAFYRLLELGRDREDCCYGEGSLSGGQSMEEGGGNWAKSRSQGHGRSNSKVEGSGDFGVFRHSCIILFSVPIYG